MPSAGLIVLQSISGATLRPPRRRPVRSRTPCGGRMVSTALTATIPAAATMMVAAVFDSTGGAAWRAWRVSCVVGRSLNGNG